VHGHAGRFVDRDDVSIFVKNVERDGFWFGAERRTWLDVDGDVFAGTEPMRAFSGTGIDEHQASGYEFLHSATTNAVDAVGYKLIEALSSVIFASN
jgi:hypothetical protein